MFFKRLSPRRRSVQRSLGLEPLEGRRLMTVTVKDADGDIYISGDGANNGVAVFQDAIRRLFIYGDIATAIAGDGTVAGAIADTNAGGGREFDPGQFTDIFINMGSGNDLVQVAGLQNTDVGILQINSGDASGGDNISIGQSTFAGSPDIFFGFNAVTKSVNITTGNGNDVVSVNALTAPNLSVNTGALPDVINLATTDNVVVNGDVSLNLGDGGGVVNVAQNSHAAVIDGNLNVTGGSGNDFLTLDAVTVGNVEGNLSVATGSGNDNITADGLNVAHGSLLIDSGDATTGDTINVGTNAAVTASGDATIRTGSGPDIINLAQLSSVNLDVHTNAGADTVNLGTTAAASFTGNVSIDTGNVTTGGDTVHVGAAAHAVAITGGLAITTGNGNDTLTLDHLTVGGDASISLGGGFNSITIGGAAAVAVGGNVTIKTGSGANTVNVAQLSAGNVNILTGAGVDHVTLSHVTASGDLSVSLGAGNNQLSIADTIAANATITGGVGADNVSLVHDTLGNLKLAASDGNNIIVLSNTNISGTAGLVTGSGNDLIILKTTHINYANVITGLNNDTVNINGSVIDHIMAQLGAGNDTLNVTNSKFTYIAFLNGGSGTNRARFTSTIKPYVSAFGFLSR